MKKVLLVVASDGFQPVEYWTTKKVLEEAGFEVETASDRAGVAKAAYEGEDAPVDLTLLEVNIDDYAGIYFIGGPGALTHLDHETSYRIIRESFKNSEPFGAICLSPRILAHAGVMAGKKMTGWDDDNKLDIECDRVDAKRTHEAVVTDGNVITANGPKSAEEFGEAIVKLLK